MAVIEIIKASSYTFNDSWKTAPSRWGHPLHKMVSRIGSFPPALAHWFLVRFSKPNDVVLDPFSGKGTAPLEACLLGRVGIGNDLSPDAFTITHAKVRAIAMRSIYNWVLESRKLTNILKNQIKIDEAPDEVQVFFHKETLKQILIVRSLLLDKKDDASMFIKALMLGILHGPCEHHLSVKCSHSFSMSPNYIKKYVRKYRLKKPRRDVFDSLLRKAMKVLSKGIPPVKGLAFNNDAKNLPLEDESVDLIITSPPYLSVLTTAWDNWLRLWFLGYDYKDVEKKLTQTSSPNIYIAHMRDFLKEFFRVLKANRACVLVLGDIKVARCKRSLADLVIKAGEEVGFGVKMTIDDDIRLENKYLAQHKCYNGGLSKEKIIVFEKGVAPIFDARPFWVSFNQKSQPKSKTSFSSSS